MQVARDERREFVGVCGIPEYVSVHVEIAAVRARLSGATAGRIASKISSVGVPLWLP